MKSMTHAAPPCPLCGRETTTRVIREESFPYKDVVHVVPGVASFECQACGEAYFDPAQSRWLEQTLADMRRATDGLLTSEEIRAIREDFHLTQTQFAELLKVGEKNFARYETGASTQERGMDWFLRALREEPTLLHRLVGYGGCGGGGQIGEIKESMTIEMPVRPVRSSRAVYGNVIPLYHGVTAPVSEETSTHGEDGHPGRACA